MVLWASSLGRTQVGYASVPRACDWGPSRYSAGSKTVWRSQHGSFIRLALGRVVGSLVQPELPLLHPVSGFHHVGLSSSPVRYFTWRCKAPRSRQRPPIVFKSAPRMARGHSPYNLAVKVVPDPPGCQVRRNRQVSGGRRAQKWESSLTPHSCVFKEQGETKSCYTWRKK